MKYPVTITVRVSRVEMWFMTVVLFLITTAFRCAGYDSAGEVVDAIWRER